MWEAQWYGFSRQFLQDSSVHHAMDWPQPSGTTVEDFLFNSWDQLAFQQGLHVEELWSASTPVSSPTAVRSKPGLPHEV